MHQPVKTPARAAGPSTTASTTPMPPKLASTTSWMPKNSPSATAAVRRSQWDPCPPAGTDAVHVRMVPGGTQQEDEADCHQQRRSSDDGVDPVAEGVGQFRQPVGQGVVVVINKHRGQPHCNPHGISVLNNAGAGPFRICPVIGKSELPRTIIFCKPRVPELPAGLILYHDVRDVPLRTVAVCCFRIHLVYLLFTVPDQEIEKRLPVSQQYWKTAPA